MALDSVRCALELVVSRRWYPCRARIAVLALCAFCGVTAYQWRLRRLHVKYERAEICAHEVRRAQETWTQRLGDEPSASTAARSNLAWQEPGPARVATELGLAGDGSAVTRFDERVAREDR